jgi:hypothetical protein
VPPPLLPTAGATGSLVWYVQCRVKTFHLAAVAALTTGLAACGAQAVGRPAEPLPAGTGTALPAGTGTALPAGTATALPAGTATAQPSSPAPTLTGPATLTVADNGAVVRLRTGQQVAVTLTAGSFFSWHVPAAAGAAVRRVSASGGYPSQQPAQAAFLAVQPGKAMLSTISDTACLHAQPACEPPQQEWRVTIMVTGG